MPKQILGTRYGKFVAVGRLHKYNRTGSYLWLFKCDCGESRECLPLLARNIGHCGCQYKSLEERLVSFLLLNEATDCWEFKGWKNNKGYGAIGVSGNRLQYAHRVAWMLWKGSIPEGICVLHRCDNPPCCNPDHLFLGTFKDNLDDARNKGRWWGRMPLKEAQAKGHICKHILRAVAYEKERLGL